MEVTRVVNLTGHDLIFISENNKVVTLKAADERARVVSQMVPFGVASIHGQEIELTEVRTREIVHLPKEEKGVIYVVSGLVEAVAHRADVFCPGRVLKDNKGRAIGARALIQRI